MISLHLGDQFVFANANLQKAMRSTFPAFEAKTRGRKRKLAATNLEDYDSVFGRSYSQENGSRSVQVEALTD